ncbi:YybH family protein [Streptomonospora nanhaiensis]|uniref:Ketosteroid isomerase-like protein n=1 Tax=Streptomonospora nanhaiensis TaxID=1323731 RepID=A0A853BQG6_9ACTN|nr:DUF4440 domain-containing protein [Streptomonospora nanhaiensis]MBV2363878.1 DUF4440 domain-containing protein [Streptomonospora nanhaiensis]MBX9388246.1 DUF4440 domain-containing protein [Streptomonospora nanhaiensis]NYI96817.1 ketosteroid isomerase-like protein [Streptomonospora nanhaiensis]
MMSSSPRTPHEVPAAFAERFNTGRVERVLELFPGGAVLVPEPGAPVSGAGLAGGLAGHLSLGLPISVAPRHVYVSGDVALLIVDWRIEGTAAGEEVALRGTATDVVRRGPDGVWRYAVDNPHGTA